MKPKLTPEEMKALGLIWAIKKYEVAMTERRARESEDKWRKVTVGYHNNEQWMLDNTIADFKDTKIDWMLVAGPERTLQLWRK